MPSSCLLRLPDIITFRLCMQCSKSITFIRYYATTGRESLNFTQKVVPQCQTIALKKRICSAYVKKNDKQEFMEYQMKYTERWAINL